jgi:predicted anti-sigma-YlaC factor YlaD
MDHQPFENWITDPRSQTADDAHALQQHLETCPQCRALKAGWQSAEAALRFAPQLSPTAGFTGRWQATQAQRLARQHLRQTRILLFSLASAALVSLLILVAVFFSTTSPVSLLVSGTRLITSMNSWLITAQHFITSMLSNPIPLAIWIGLGCGFSLLVVFWMLSLWRISIKGVQTK